MAEKSITKFGILYFNWTNFAPWKLKMNMVLVKDNYEVILLGKEDKLKGMMDK